MSEEPSHGVLCFAVCFKKLWFAMISLLKLLGASWANLGAVVGRLGAVFDPPRQALALLGRSLVVRERSWARVGAS